MHNWEGITEFVAVAERNSFTKASKYLDISTAQVSRQINALEERLNVKLFYRTTRKVTITETGQIYYNHCRQVLDSLTEAERVITDLNQSPQGRLNLTAPVTYGESVIAPLVNDFALKYPDLKIDLTLTNQKLDLVAESYDLAIRLGQLEDSSMIAKRLSSRTNYVCASPQYFKKHPKPLDLAELDQHNCLRGTLDTWRFKVNSKNQHIRIKGSLQCNSGWSLVDAALKGIGLIQLPDYYVQSYIETGRLLSVLDHVRSFDDGIWAIYPHNRQLSSKVRLLIEHLKQGLTREPLPA
ncbi:LysR family transcriptional regulator [Kiloniella spongiae]|uniref:LysR family transcriptional regulator n=1 Tax=Kiloniella spongiae TaxID=1489064 RepID=A0A0H2M9W0_9PROT|nr:LysR substrate-binding domain-containing protein [Kiloniella spongiae]KLN59123.1 LysR family transcriptional regulator [Kiloniella spongiae]